MRLLISIVLIAFLSAISEYVFPWWTIALVAFLVTVFANLSSGKSFLAGFTGVLLLWLAVALVIDFRNDHILSQRMAELFGLAHSSLFIVVAALVGGLVGGLAGGSGAVVRKNLF